ncbi:hypothetical protein EJ05DRAFT_438010 [Pseudovirgaria hyperparasitica]|uniref:UBC core domain-containing protein n=1 Tax=Pseudovirgaria hyperparasitica TaxID=470096 RepID=A0A6A6WA34_9PEZI|nr:uncharacterized protein EJ05DRAFT_438010 [Pseudovirgaria hyperparasitica]KAF2758447.1 hypothetical protein EJ05DRAFT_438010 [Pseudovirgaria hyperparasitica]
MPRKAFIADLTQVIENTAINGIRDVHKGDDDGEFVFTVDNVVGSANIELVAKISDVSDYPSSHSCFFIAPDTAPAAIAMKLGDLFEQTAGKSVQKLLHIVAKATQSRLDDDVEMPDSQEAYSDLEEDELDSGQDDSDEDEGEDYFPDEMLSLRLPNHTGHSSGQLMIESTLPFRSRIRSDLLMAKAAGFKVGALAQLLDGGPCYVTLSVRVGKLGISCEAMQAWQVKASEYLVLVLHYPYGYHSIDALLKLGSKSCRRALEIRVGVSNTYKPTLPEAVHAFTSLAKDEAKNQANSNTGFQPSDLNLGFRNAFISGPLNEFLNERLIKIISYRYNRMAWGGAEEFLADHMATSEIRSSLVDDRYLAEEHIAATFPSIVRADHIHDVSANQRHSFPLIAMQATLRHFVRCTEFCLVCFRKLPNDLEAIKPYVCDNPLCLYQYMSLGFGPSIEHEILAQHKVVDLLISFCYVSATGGGLNSFPSGLSLLVPPPASSSLSTNMDFAASYPGTGPHMVAKYDHSVRQLTFESEITCPIRNGDWIVVRIPKIEAALHARVIETTYFPVVTLSEFVQAPDTSAKSAAAQQPRPGVNSPPYPQTPSPIPLNPQKVNLYPYNRNFDDLNDDDKRGAISSLLDILPGVPEMKDYLQRKGVASLASWIDRVPPAAISLLRWIIASSRACIVECESGNGDPNRRDERVFGMDGWTQFRFAMGAPDKERRFLNAVQTTMQRKSLTYPTLYAWHGSALNNWHGIIREGLHFKNIAHGRAFGDGVYHSLDARTSLGYSHMSTYSRNGASPRVWPSSELKISSAIALNEVVNAPDEFQSRNPHLVVQHVDWIQTRYLFVKSPSMADPLNVVIAPTEAQAQDPVMTPQGEGGKIVIPAKANTQRKRSNPLSASIKAGFKRLKGSGQKSDPISIEEDIDIDFDDTASVNTLQEDLEIFREEESSIHLSQPSNDSGTTVEISQTDFIPGKLDAESLPKLIEPMWATHSATRRLQQDFKAVLKVQAKEPLHELGWYINPDHINNMYQWIIELHSFESHLPLAKDMKKKDLRSVVLEFRFGKDYPMSPPFVRVVRPRFLGFQQGGGGHVTAGGALCMELLTNTGWSAVSSIESVLLQVRLAMSSLDPRPARLEPGPARDYSIGEAVEAYIRACRTHGWTVPEGFKELAYGGEPASDPHLF